MIIEESFNLGGGGDPCYLSVSRTKNMKKKPPWPSKQSRREFLPYGYFSLLYYFRGFYFKILNRSINFYNPPATKKCHTNLSISFNQYHDIYSLFCSFQSSIEYKYRMNIVIVSFVLSRGEFLTKNGDKEEAKSACGRYKGCTDRNVSVESKANRSFGLVSR